ncbi:hypothetical protein BsWGS_11569 [Bradybaena similaris]
MMQSEEHQNLVAVIKDVHRYLRREYRESNQAYEQVWQKHILNQPRLQLYADAMYRLATEHWSVYPETRIDWCRKVAVEYFYHNGLQVALQKDAKRQFHKCLRAKKKSALSEDTISTAQDFSGVNPVSVDSLSCLESKPSQSEPSHDQIGGCDGGCESSAAGAEGITRETEITLPLTSRIRLLDVGSCYNPFLTFDEFDVLSIDLSPAKQTVLQCDFLKLATSDSAAPVNPLDFNLSNLSSPVLQLPCASFHVVVFSLLLEYLPAAEQRWQCCVKAHSLLAVNGLLLIVTPDSHSQHRNAPMMKSWKQAIESLGFQRWKYEKKDHIHCMAFRKVAWKPMTTDDSLQDNVTAADVKDMLYIPQDFNGACYDDAQGKETSSLASPGDSEAFMKLTMEELPLLELVDS